MHSVICCSVPINCTLLSLELGIGSLKILILVFVFCKRDRERACQESAKKETHRSKLLDLAAGSANDGAHEWLGYEDLCLK